MLSCSTCFPVFWLLYGRLVFDGELWDDFSWQVTSDAEDELEEQEERPSAGLALVERYLLYGSTTGSVSPLFPSKKSFRMSSSKLDTDMQ